MCGRFVLMALGKLVAEQFELDDEPNLEPRYNIAPSQQVAAVCRIPETKKRELRMFRWGLIPFWAKDEKIGHKLINAKSETVAEKPAFRAAFKHKRCLIPADGFYEWKRREGKKTKQPHFIRMKNGEPFALAGLWENWESPEGKIIESCVILTTNSNNLIQSLHDRMPVIVLPQDYELWLNTAITDTENLKRLFTPHPQEAMEAYEVSVFVNGPSNEDPECIEPI
ncbi:MAG: SOS response-associated peptidase [Deltaproteobacteria bacterium]|nr:SOS response-associated peptidase [Deltaproteobacteria bacterium]